jgi:hypothetical protein
MHVLEIHTCQRSASHSSGAGHRRDHGMLSHSARRAADHHVPSRARAWIATQFAGVCKAGAGQVGTPLQVMVRGRQRGHRRTVRPVRARAGAMSMRGAASGAADSPPPTARRSSTAARSRWRRGDDERRVTSSATICWYACSPASTGELDRDRPDHGGERARHPRGEPARVVTSRPPPLTPLRAEATGRRHPVARSILSGKARASVRSRAPGSERARLPGDGGCCPRRRAGAPAAGSPAVSGPHRRT